MTGFTLAPAPPPSAALRHLILGTAMLLALAVWLAPKIPAAAAQEPKAGSSQGVLVAPPAPAIPPSPAIPPGPVDIKGGSKHGISISIGNNSGAESAKAAPGADGSAAVRKEVLINEAERTVTVKKGGKTVTVTGIPTDEEIDSAVELGLIEPVLGTIFVAIVAVIFLSPVIAIALILSYRMRKARMMNETMLKLAEKGIAPSADLLAAAGGGKAVAVASPAPIYEHSRELRARTAWSDLRKGVVMGAIGAAITVYSSLDDRSPNIVGLVLLFVGIGYAVLWWFEQRQVAPAARGNDHPPGPGGVA